MKYFFIAAPIAMLLLTSCATAPKPLQGQFDKIEPVNATSSLSMGKRVRWGGKIIQTQPKQDQTCFQILSSNLYGSARPTSNMDDNSLGRFIACHKGFYDPEVFSSGRLVTFVGTIQGTEQVHIGSYDYTVPKISADVIYLWPEYIPSANVYPIYALPPPYFRPWGPSGYWGGFWGFGGGFW